MRWLVLLWLFAVGGLAAGDDAGWPPVLPVELQHRPASVRLYPAEGEVRGLLVFGSGDGGWSYWENRLSRWYSEDGFAVAGLDLREYSANDYTGEQLAGDFTRVTRAALAALGREDLPVLYGGWSMGAVQIVPASDPRFRPPQLRGLLLFSADSRGRFGLRPSDELGITPKGPGTWALGEFNAYVRDLRVAQFHGTADFMASITWVHELPSPHALYFLKNANHGFDGPDEEFRPVLLRGAHWALGDDSAAPVLRDQPESRTAMIWAVAIAGLALAAFLVSEKLTHVVVPAAVVAVGLTALMQAIAPGTEGFAAHMERWFPVEIGHLSRFLLALSGVALLLLAKGLLRRKRVAWYATLAVLIFAGVMHLVRAFAWQHMLGNLVMLAALLRHRKHYDARSDAPSVRLSLAFAGVALLLFAGMGTVLIKRAAQAGQLGEAIGWRRALETSVATLFQVHTELEDQAGRSAARLLESLRLQGLAVGVVALAGVLRPVVARRKQVSDWEKKRVADLVREFGDDPMSAFATLEDKHYFFGGGDNGVVAYALWRDHAVVLADPICAPAQREHWARAFARFCGECDWKPVFYCAHHSMREVYERLGFQLVRVAEDARLDLNTFKLEGTKFQNLRTARNKAKRNGLVFGWYEASAGVDEALERDLEEVSTIWVRRKHGGEMGFDLGRFERSWLRTVGVGWVRDAQGRLLAFATWNTFAQGRGRCLDLMRGREEARDVIDFLILESFDRFRGEGAFEVSLGNAPLANVDADSEHDLRSGAIHFVFRHFDRFYGYKRLFAFKQKYFPDWRPRYVAYPKDTTLAMVGMAIAGVHLPRGFRGLWKS